MCGQPVGVDRCNVDGLADNRRRYARTGPTEGQKRADLEGRIAVLEETAAWVARWVVFVFFEVVLFFLPFPTDQGRPRPPAERPGWVVSAHDRWYGSAMYVVAGLLFVAVVLVGGYLLYVIVVALVLMWALGIDGVATPVLVTTVFGAIVAGLAVTVIVARLHPGRDATLPLFLPPVLFEILVFTYLRLQQ